MNIVAPIQRALYGSVLAQIRFWKLLVIGHLVPLPVRLVSPKTCRRLPLSPSEGERAGVRGPHWPCCATPWQMALIAGALIVVFPLRGLAAGEQ